MKIKFSHIYPKIWNQKKAELIAVRIIDAQAVQINKDLLEYDTVYISSVYPLAYRRYELPKEGKLIQLIFIGDKDIPFCTLRRYTQEKYEYYQNSIGEIFEVEVTENEDNNSKPKP